MSTGMLDVTGLHARYGRIQILHGVDLRVSANEVVGILGHNGMGKTTLLKTLIGLLPSSGGRILFEGREVAKMPAYRRSLLGFGYIPQGREIFSKLTAMENLRIGAARHFKTAAEIDRTIDEVIAEIPRLEPILSRPGGVLSGGEQQILALGRCLCSRPRLLMLDEPTEGIQPSIVHEFAEILAKLKSSSSISIILVEQNLDFIAALSDRVYVIRRGRMVGEIGPELLADPNIVQEFVGMGTAPTIHECVPSPHSENRARSVE